MILNKDFKIKKVLVDSENYIRLVYWELTMYDVEEIKNEIKHQGEVRFSEGELFYNKNNKEVLKDLVLEKSGGEELINSLEELSLENLYDNKIKKECLVAYDDDVSEKNKETSFNVGRFKDLIVWSSKFSIGQVKEDQFPIPNSLLLELVEEGQWVTKPQVMFVKSGSFHIETAAGEKYLIDSTTPPRKWHCAIHFKFVALEKDSEIVCIKNRAKNPMIAYDSTRLLPKKGENLTLGGDTETTIYIVAGEFEDDVKNKLGSGYMKRLLVGETMTLKPTKDNGNIIVASNPQPYEFEVTSTRPDYATARLVE